MLIAWLAALVAIVGLVVFLAAKEKAAEIGRIMFFVGLLLCVWVAGQRTIHIP
jgi:Na+/phosphate symporter